MGGWSRSTDFLIVVPTPLWRKVFLQKWATATITEGDALEEKNQTHQLRNEARLNCVSLRSSLDYEVAWIAVKGRDERPAGALDRSPRHREVTGCKKKERPPRRP